MKKFLVGMGIGSARVDFEIPQPRVELGGTLSGTVKIYGGSVDQQIEEVSITLVVTSQFVHGEQVRGLREEIGTIKVADRMLVRANSPEITLPVNFKLPYNIPISRGRTKYHFETSLEIKNAVDPKDVDAVIVLPNAYMQMVFEALYSLGFRDKPTSGDYNGRFQQFEYKPTRFMARQLDELEVCMEDYEDRLNIYMEIDKKTGGFLGKLADDLDLDERHVGFSFLYRDMGNAEQVALTLKEIIEREYSKIAY